MSSSQDQTHDNQREQGPDILHALRQSLIEDPRLGTVAVHADGRGTSDSHHATAQNEIHRASGTSVAKSSGDQNLTQARLQSNGIPADSPSIAPMEPSIELNPGQANRQTDGTSYDRPIVGRRIFHHVARGFVFIAMIGVAFALLSYGDAKTKDVIRTWDLTLSWLSSVVRTSSSQGPDVATASVSKSLDQTPLRNTALLPATVGIHPPPPLAAPRSSPELQHQLETMTSDLAVLRHLVEQLAARQSQMAQDLATLQTTEQNIGQKIPLLSQFRTVRIPRKKVVSKKRIKSSSDRAPAAASQARFGTYPDYP
jgi:hypothetical protein